MVPRARGSHQGLPRPVKAGTTVTPAAVGHRRGQGPEILGPLDDAQPVAQPLDGRPGHEGRALQGVGDRAGAAAVARSPRSQATVATSPSGGGGQADPALARTKLPVP